MGIEISPPPVYGNDCPACTPSLFPVGETPKFITATITGDWIACPDFSLPGAIWVLEQSPILACVWSLITTNAICTWSHGLITSTFQIYKNVPPPHPHFFIQTIAKCEVEYANAMTEAHCLIGEAGWGGVCNITW